MSHFTLLCFINILPAQALGSREQNIFETTSAQIRQISAAARENIKCPHTLSTLSSLEHHVTLRIKTTAIPRAERANSKHTEAAAAAAGTGSLRGFINTRLAD